MHKKLHKDLHLKRNKKKTYPPVNNISISPLDKVSYKNEINVTYSGAIPNLFSEGKGVVAEGFLNDRSFFNAKKILAKHDENYMPPEVKEALEKNK